MAGSLAETKHMANMTIGEKAVRTLRGAFTLGVIRPVKIGMERFIRALGPSGRATFFDPSDFSWTRELEAGFPLIRGELDRVLSADRAIPDFAELSPPQRALVQGKSWKSYFLFLTGEPMATHCVECPETARLLRRIPGLENAFFSILEPGTHLTPHRGPYAGLLRYHLGLRIPQRAEACGIRVGGDTASWAEGSSLIFDDSHDHEAWNDSDEVRVILFVDFARPLPAPLGWANAWTLRLVARAAFIEELRANLGTVRTTLVATET